MLYASVRHLGTDINYIVLENMFKYLENRVDFHFNYPVETIAINGFNKGYTIFTKRGISFTAEKVIVSVGRSGSKWMQDICKDLRIPTKSNRVDIGVRVEIPSEVFSHITDELYESKIVYQTKQYGDKVRTFCMNPK